MKYILILVFSLLSFSSLVSQNVIDRHFEYLVETEDATNINVTGKMFELLNNIDVDVESDEQEDIEEMQDFLGSIKSFQLVAAKQVNNARQEFDKGNRKLSGDYEELLSVLDKDGNFMLYIDEHNGTVHEVVGIGTDNEQLMVFSLMGSMKLEHVGKVAEQIHTVGGDHLSKVRDLDIDAVKVYPNPITTSFNLETPDSFDGGVATLYDSNGAMVKTYKINSVHETYEVDKIPAGNYVLKLVKGEVSIRKKIVVVK